MIMMICSFIEPETDNYLMNHQIKHELHPLYYSSTMKANENLKEKERIEEMLLTSTVHFYSKERMI